MNDNIFRLSFGYALTGCVSLALTLSLFWRQNDSNWFLLFGYLLLIFLLPFLMSYSIWYFMFSKKLRKAEYLYQYQVQSILGAFFMTLVSASLIGTASLLMDKSMSFDFFMRNTYYILIYIFVGMVFSAPFCIIYGLFLGKSLYLKKN